MYLFIDPGKIKFGWAVFSDNRGKVSQGTGKTGEFDKFCQEISENHKENLKIILGNGTYSEFFSKKLKFFFQDIDLIDETGSTDDARKLFFKENPPRGLRRFIPTGLQVPERDYDDYTARILAERYFSGHR